MGHLPPGPKYIHPVKLMRFIADPVPLELGLFREYGDPCLIPSLVGPVVLTADPEAVRAIFTADPDTFEPLAPELSAPLIGETSLVLVSGARHKRDRKLLMPPFHGARMRAYGRLMVSTAERAAARWAPGEPFDMLRTTQAISLEIIMRAVFGVEDTRRGTEIGDAILESVRAMTPLVIFFKFLRHNFGGIGPWAHFLRASRRVNELLLAELATRRQKEELGDDILSLMMSARYEDGGSMSDNDLRDELLTLLLAGHETTAISLAWAFYWLARQPEDLGRVLSEIEALGPHPEPDAIAALPFLDAVCHEALRIHPIVPDIMRKLRKPFDLLGYTIPAGTGLAASMMLLHQREDLYPEPHRFRPSRFLERKLSPYEFIPFGGGARRCLGAAFAMYEMKIVLATLLRSRRLRLATNATIVPARRGFTFGPKGGVWMCDDGMRSPAARAA